MEENQILDSSVSEGNNLQVTYQMRSYLNEVRKWAKFFAIMGFIGIGFLALISLIVAVAGLASTGFGYSFGLSLGMVGIYLVLALLYLPPIIYLNKFSNRMKIALGSMSNSQLELAFENLKSLFKYAGILTIIIFSLYIFVIIGMVLAGASSLFNF